MTPHLAFPAVTFEALEAELGRELEQRRRFYPGRVEKGRMLQEDAEWELAIALAWREDVARIRACWLERPGSPPTRPAHGLSWNDRRRGLLRELDMRGRFYPGWIDSGRLLERDAAHQLACLECLLAIYEDGWDWTGSGGKTPHHSPIAEQDFRALRAEVDARTGRTQKELALG